MSQNSSITEDDHPLPRYDNHQRQNGIGREMQMMPLAMSTPIARRTLIIPNQTDIVNVLSDISVMHRHAIYISSGTGYISQASWLTPVTPQFTQQQRPHNCCGQILYMSGWFQQMFTCLGDASRVNGVLHVGLSCLQGITIATRLVASGYVGVDVVFICGPGSVVPPDAPGGLREPIPLLVRPAPPQPMAG